MNRFILIDRQDGGQSLAVELSKLNLSRETLVVLALPRGGVILADEIARELHVPFEILVVRKIGSPFNPELAIGAIAEGNSQVFDESSLSRLKMSQAEFQAIVDREELELKRRVNIYRPGRHLPDMNNKTVILVDDGLATGFTALAAIKTVSQYQPQSIMVVSPVCSQRAARLIKREAELLCIYSPPEMSAIGAYYTNFDQVTDQEVLEILTHSNAGQRK